MYKYNLNNGNVEVVSLDGSKPREYDLVGLTVDVSRRHICWAERGEIRFINYLCQHNRRVSSTIHI